MEAGEAIAVENVRAGLEAGEGGEVRWWNLQASGSWQAPEEGGRVGARWTPDFGLKRLEKVLLFCV